MHIKEIIIDGFKSYAVKTTIQGFDRHFNAITGLNGSGKSNIFDSICFLLGISSLTNVRASNLQELIYNKGNTGITKASVTIIFDNKDKKGSPMGCEDYDEIIVSRVIYQNKTKYYLNGYIVNQDNIKSLFQSVQLNINNPHFLILQGKIRQVVHMKPIEILGLLEEAAGTSIYEMKKDSSLKLIKKKENKLEEITKILNEDISPQLEKLMRDKQNYLTWKSKENEISRISKILTANDYYVNKNNANAKRNELVQYKSQSEEMRTQINATLQEIMALDQKLKEKLEKFKDFDENNEVEKKVKEKKMLIKTETHKIEQMKEGMKNSRKEISKNEQQISEAKIKIDSQEKEKAAFVSNFEMFEKQLQHQKEYLKEIEINAQDGKAEKNGKLELVNLNKLISDCLNNKNKSAAEKANLQSQIQFLSEESKNKNAQLTEYNQRLKQCEKHSKNFNKEITEIEKEMKSLNPSEGASSAEMLEVINRQIIKRQTDLEQFERQQNEILNRYASRVEVQFRDPEPNFDRTRVKGRIIRNFTLENEKYTKAIEQAAGGRLYNIIVDNENTASLLLSRKCFDYGVTMIPNNKIMSKQIPADKLRLIEDISKGEARLALDLIKFKEELLPAMRFVFGNIFVCSTSEVASKIAFADNIRVKCVNLDGDIFDPSGTLTGGSSVRGESILKKVVELTAIQNKIANERKGILEAKNDLEGRRENQKRLNELASRLDNVRRQASEFDKESISAKIKEIENEITKTSEIIKKNEERIEELNEFEKRYSDELKKLQKEQKEFSEASGTKKKDMLVKKITGVKKEIKYLEGVLSETKTKINDSDYQINELKKEISDRQDFIKNEKESYDQVEREIEGYTHKISKYENELNKLEAEYYEMKKERLKNEGELSEIKKEKEELTNKKDSSLSEIKKLENKINKYEKEIKDSDDKMRKLEEQNEWIISEYSFFGMKDTDYDFSTLDPKTEYEKLSKLKEENAILKRKVNMKVDIMADQYEKEYNDLVKKKEIIVKDKQNIQNAIDELDKKRKDALNDIYAQVNKSINSIYSTLLPGTKAKLSQVDPSSLMKGLELKVAFGGHWKNSLSELSGGQVSLLALSLILALLLYKPAPIYIFDEIDAALDLSHTANLGLMLKEHFPQSQFIVISLKDGMFNNANVLYKVSYVDGSSRVERITKNTI